MKISWTIVSIFSRLTSVGIGIIQSYIVLSLLSYSDYGLIRIVLSVVAMAGVLQNLGISSGSTREISSAKDMKQVGKVFIASLAVRYMMSAPVAILIMLGSSYISNFYNVDVSIVNPLIIFGIIILLQASQSTLKSLVQGLHKFGFLFTHQIFEAIGSLFLMVYFIYASGFIGFFYAQLCFTLLSVISLAIYGIYLLKDSFELPNKTEFITILKSVFKIGIVVYLIKIIFTQWENLGPLVLGKISSPETTAMFSAALFIATKVVTISDAVTDVTLPKNTKIYEQDREKFEQKFKISNSKAFSLILFASLLIIVAKVELFGILDFLMQFLNKPPISMKYAESFKYVDPLVVAFWAYSHLNLLKSGISVPAFKPMQPLYAYVVMLLGTILSFIFLQTQLDASWGFSISMMIGALAGYLFYLLLLKKSFGFIPFTNWDFWYLTTVILVLFAFYLGLISSGISIILISILVSVPFIYKSLKKYES